MAGFWHRLGRTLRREAAFCRCLLAHPETPRLSKWLLGAALAYAWLPLDLIPDWIPGLGQLDDLVLIPLLVWLAVRLVPAHVVAACRPDGPRGTCPACRGG